jgi:hypothetical protein
MLFPNERRYNNASPAHRTNPIHFLNQLKWVAAMLQTLPGNYKMERFGRQTRIEFGFHNDINIFSRSHVNANILTGGE